MAEVLKTKFVGYTQHQSGHVMAPADLVFEVEEAPAKAPLIPFLAMVAVRVTFALSPFLLAMTWAVQAGWLPS